MLLDIVNNDLLLEYASCRLKDYIKLVIKAVIQNPNALVFASNKCKDTEYIIFIAIKQMVCY